MNTILPKNSSVIDCGIDYFTGTSTGHTDNRFFDTLGTRLLGDEHSQGSDIVQWFLRGFSGMTSGQCQFGTNGSSRLMRLSGHLAQTHWRQVYEHCSNVSRIDCQVTVHLGVPKICLAELAERQARLFELNRHHGRQIELRRNHTKGKTLYIGSRKSDRLIRLYDKGMQTKLDPAGTVWRAEIQYQNRLAQHMAHQVFREEPESYPTIPLLHSELTRVGIVWMTFGTTSSLKASSAQIRRNTDMRLSWLKSQVKPTVQRLIDAGRLAETLDALGLSDVVCEREV